MPTGTIKSFLADKAFGFIKVEGRPDMFFHVSAVKPEELGKIVRGAHVEFEVNLKRGKEQASSVTVVSSPKQTDPTVSAFPRKKIVHEELSELEEFEKEWGLRVAGS